MAKRSKRWGISSCRDARAGVGDADVWTWSPTTPLSRIGGRRAERRCPGGCRGPGQAARRRLSGPCLVRARRPRSDARARMARPRVLALRRVSVSETSSSWSASVSPSTREAVPRSAASRRSRSALVRMPPSSSSRSALDIASQSARSEPAEPSMTAVGRAQLVGRDRKQVDPLVEEPAALLLVLALLGQVAGDLGETDVVPAVVVDRADHHARPEAASVLAHSPPLLGEAAVAQGCLEIALAGAPSAWSSCG